jgi:hypothetical protein
MDESPSAILVKREACLEYGFDQNISIQYTNTDLSCAGCFCERSYCIKMYCQCFAEGRYCATCRCINCHNTPYNTLLGRVIREKNKGDKSYYHEAIEKEGIECNLSNTLEEQKTCHCSRSQC